MIRNITVVKLIFSLWFHTLPSYWKHCHCSVTLRRRHKIYVKQSSQYIGHGLVITRIVLCGMQFLIHAITSTGIYSNRPGQTTFEFVDNLKHVDMLYDKGSTKDFEQHFCKSSIRIHILMYHTLEIQIIQITYQHQSCISISNKIQQNSQHLGEWVYMLKTICFLKLVVISTTILISSSEKTIQCFQTITVFCIRISPSIVLFFV